MYFKGGSGPLWPLWPLGPLCLGPFYIVSYFIKWVKTSGAYSMRGRGVTEIHLHCWRSCVLMLASPLFYVMEPIKGGNPKIGAHYFGILICLSYFFTLKAVENIIVDSTTFFPWHMRNVLWVIIYYRYHGFMRSLLPVLFPGKS